MICCAIKPNNKKHGIYHPLPVPTLLWERISMDFVGGLSTTRKGHDYLFVVVDNFNKMCVLIPCKKTISDKETTNFFFGHSMAALWDTKEQHYRQGYKISQCILDYIMGQYRHKVREIYNIPSKVRSGQWDFGVSSEGIQAEASEDMGWKYGIYTTLLQQRSPHFYRKVPIWDLIWIFSTFTFGYCIWEAR